MKILIVKLSSLGDVLHMFPAVSDLRRHFPGAVIHWLVEPAFAEAVSWHSAVNKVITIPLRAHKKIWWKLPALLNKLRRQLKAENYDVVLDAQGLVKSALLSRLSGVDVFGFAADTAREPLAARFYKKSASVQKGVHVIEKNRHLVAKTFSCEITNDLDFGLAEFRHESMQSNFSAALTVMTHEPYIVLLHGTTWNSKYWPESAWVELIGMLSQWGVRCLLPWGNEEERQRATRLQIAGGEHAQVLPKLSLTELMNVLLRARGFVSVESGIGHLAAALDVPGAMLHGPTSPNYSGILGKGCLHITSGVACSPCFKRDCPILNEAGVPPCQEAMTAQQVYQHCLVFYSQLR
jgi:heptosyltransferase-1